MHSRDNVEGDLEIEMHSQDGRIHDFDYDNFDQLTSLLYVFKSQSNLMLHSTPFLVSSDSIIMSYLSTIPAYFLASYHVMQMRSVKFAPEPKDYSSLRRSTLQVQIMQPIKYSNLS